jgi:IS5 family transposase
VDKKGGKNYFGYKNHIGIDAEHRLIRRYVVTNASIEILTRQNRIKGVY